MGEKSAPIRVAIACQGGGAHTAFTAGVLDKVLEQRPRQIEITALSGTSGGAVCALLAWYGLSKKDPEMARQLLSRFWADNSAHSVIETLWNYWALWAARSPVEARVSPYCPGLDWILGQASAYDDLMKRWLGFTGPGAFSSWSALARTQLSRFSLRNEFLDFQRLLEKHIEFSDLPQKAETPRLLVGAVEVCAGTFKAFDSRKDLIVPETILASAAIPSLFKAVHLNNGVYWDGLFSQNPPLKEFLQDVPLTDKPDEIWVIQINPRRRETEPRSVEEILDRRNELSGNVSLEQEISAIETLNKVVQATEDLFKAHPEISSSPAAEALRKYKTVKIRRIEIDEGEMAGAGSFNLDHASKLDRSPAFIQRLIDHGKRQAQSFLTSWSAKASHVGSA